MQYSYHNHDVSFQLAIENNHIVAISFAVQNENPLPSAIKAIFDAYFSIGTPLNVPFIMPKGTVFQQHVWRELCDIPYGKTASYKDIARAIGKPKAARAVGMACNKNSLPILVPCHRVVSSTGRLTGYAGGVKFKEKLLYLESLQAL